MSGIDTDLLKNAIDKTRKWFWSDPGRHRDGRLNLETARRQIVAMSLGDIGINNPALAEKIANEYRSLRETAIQPFPDAVDTVRWLRARGCRLALLTNGNGVSQRSKVSRFGLADLFDLILIEGEVGFGKPDRRIYDRALEELGVAADESWMIGDNLEWDVVEPQKLGILGIWLDVREEGLPANILACPNRILRRLSDLREDF
jgi:putative hydrolase of the HAD superfamily